MKEKEIIIKSISGFHKRIRKLKGFVYRGQPNAAWQVESSAYRRLTSDSARMIGHQPANSLLIDYSEDLIRKARMRGFIPHGLGERCTKLDLLAHLRHHGAATGLIDFTIQPLVSLWFACDGFEDKDGAVYALSRSNMEEIDEQDNLNEEVKFFYEKEKPSLWQPSATGNRIIAQGSVFLFGDIKSLDMKKFVIKAEDKKDIKRELETAYGISEESLFSDFSGYAVANASHKDFDVIGYWTERIDQISGENESDEMRIKKAEDYFNRGMEYRITEKYEEAEKDFDEVIKLNPKYADAYGNRGYVRGCLRRFEPAIEDYDEAIRINPENAVYHSYRGLAKQYLKRYKEALDDYGEALKLNPRSVSAYYGRGTSKNSLKRYKEAIDDFDQTITLNPEYIADAYFHRGFAKHSIGKHKEAKDDYDEVITLNPEHATAFYNRGLCWLSLKDQDKAKNDLITARDKGMKLPPDIEALLAPEQDKS